MSALLEAADVTFAYGSRVALADVSMALGEGEAVALLGPNGSGKTTLLKLLLGLVAPTRGSIRLRGRALHELGGRARAHDLAYVPQVHRESFDYSVLEVVLMGRMPHAGLFGRFGAADRAAAWEALEGLGIGHLADRPYTEVSGGERQLALVGRALAQGARVLLMDEATNALDYGNQVRLLERIARLARGGIGVAFSTHHPEHALAVADRVVMLNHGRIVRQGTAAEAITSESLAELYGVDVRTFAVEGERRVCVPYLDIH